jgi:hypothetical protein
MEQIECPGCGSCLEWWNTGYGLICHCPACGEKLPDELREALWARCCASELDALVRGEVLDFLDDGEGFRLDADEIADKVMECDLINGAFFYNNQKADLFRIRHQTWLQDALDALIDRTEGSEYFLELLKSGTDRFMVEAVLAAVDHYITEQLGLEDELYLSGRELACLREKVEETPYDGRF